MRKWQKEITCEKNYVMKQWQKEETKRRMKMESQEKESLKKQPAKLQGPIQGPSTKKTKEQLEELATNGIQLSMVVFYRTVRNWNNEPQTAFYAHGAHSAAKIAKCWYTPHGIVVEQKGVWKIVPLANVLDTFVL